MRRSENNGAMWIGRAERLANRPEPPNAPNPSHHAVPFPTQRHHPRVPSPMSSARVHCPLGTCTRISFPFLACLLLHSPDVEVLVGRGRGEGAAVLLADVVEVVEVLRLDLVGPGGDSDASGQADEVAERMGSAYRCMISCCCAVGASRQRACALARARAHATHVTFFQSLVVSAREHSVSTASSRQHGVVCAHQRRASRRRRARRGSR